MPDHQPAGSVDPLAWGWAGLLVGLFALYLGGRVALQRPDAWPWYRSLLWATGLVVAGVALLGPPAARGDRDFVAHMLGHLLLGMLAPLLLVLAAPATLMLRALPTVHARRVARVLASRPVWLLTHPATAAAFSSGGLWLLYVTRLYEDMHQQRWVGVIVHFHVLLSGYLFTAAIVGIDPVRHRPSWTVRAVVLVAALAAHAILAKYLYTHPPAGVPDDQARSASVLMYYGGDAVDALLITVFCWRWYRAARPRGALVAVAGTGSVRL